jgi:rubredoxin
VSNDNPEKRSMVWPEQDFAFLNEAVLCPKAAKRK